MYFLWGLPFWRSDFCILFHEHDVSDLSRVQENVLPLWPLTPALLAFLPQYLELGCQRLNKGEAPSFVLLLHNLQLSLADLH